MPKFTPPTLKHKWAKLITLDGHEDICEEELVDDKTVYTKWTFTALGPIGYSGKPKAGIKILPLKTRADFKDAERQERLLNKINGFDVMGQAALTLKYRR